MIRDRGEGGGLGTRANHAWVTRSWPTDVPSVVIRPIATNANSLRRHRRQVRSRTTGGIKRPAASEVPASVSDDTRRRGCIIDLLPSTAMTASAQDSGYVADLAALDEHVFRISQALAAVMASVDADPSTIRAMSRRLGISRHLAWQLGRIAEASELAGALAAMPGDRGWRTVFEAFQGAGCDPELLSDLRNAVAGLHDECERRRIDRRTITAMAGGGLDSASTQQVLLRWRERESLASAEVWGTFAEARIVTYFVVPSGTGDLLDIESISSIRGLHRLGPGPNLLMEIGVSAFGALDAPRVTAEATSDGSHDWFDRKHSSPGFESEVEVFDIDRTCHLHFEGRGTSPSRSIDVVTHEFLRNAAYIHAREPREVGTFGAPVLLPQRWFVLEVMLERTIDWSDRPDAAAYSQIPGVPRRNHWSEMQRMPMAESARRGARAGLPEELESIRVAHEDMLVDAARRVDRTIEDFEVHRLVVPWPMLASNLMLRWRLPSSDSDRTS